MIVAPHVPVQNISTVATVATWTPAQEIRKCHGQRKSLQERIKMASKAGSRKRVKNLCRQFLHSRAVKVSALHRVVFEKIPADEVLQMAETVNCFAPHPETVYREAKKKKSGGFRPICKLPYRLKAAHRMVADLLQALNELPTHIYNMKGKGRDKLIRDIDTELKRGYEHVYTGDIRDCFQSVNPDALYSLPIDERVVRHTLDCRELNFVKSNSEGPQSQISTPYSNIDFTSTDGPRGLIQGSPASNIILANLLRDIPLPPENEGRVFIYSDNVAAVARTEDQCRGIAQSLTSYLREFHGGLAELVPEFFDHAKSFDILGYNLDKDGGSGDWTIHLSEGNHNKLIKKLMAALEQDKDLGHLFPIMVNITLQRMKAGFNEATDLERLVADHLEHCRCQLAPNWAQLRSKIRRELPSGSAAPDQIIDELVDMMASRELKILADISAQSSTAASRSK